MFFLHPRSDGSEVRKEGGAGIGALTNQGLKGARFLGVVAEGRVRKKERKISFTREHVKDIGSTTCIQPYRGQGYEGAMSGNCFANFRHLHLYVMDVFSRARVVRVL